MLRICLLTLVVTACLALAPVQRAIGHPPQEGNAIAPGGAMSEELRQQPADAPASDDAVFFRRLHLDMFGLPALPEELKKFVEDKDPDKRSKAIDRFLESPEYKHHWQEYWSNMIDQRLNSPEFTKEWREFWKKIKK